MNKKEKRLRWQLSMIDGFLMILVIFVLMNGLVGTGLFPAERLAGLLPGGATIVNQMLVQQMLQTVVMVGMVLLFLRLRGATLDQIGWRPFKQPGWLILSALLGVVTFFVMLYVSVWMVKLFPQWAQPQTATELIMQAEGMWESTAVIVMVSVLAPVSEELLFRGYIYHSMRQQNSMWFSVAAASLMFGCMHYDLFRLLPLTLVGVCLNLAAIRSDSLWGSIVMHGVWNFLMAAIVLAV